MRKKVNFTMAVRESAIPYPVFLLNLPKRHVLIQM